MFCVVLTKTARFTKWFATVVLWGNRQPTRNIRRLLLYDITEAAKCHRMYLKRGAGCVPVRQQNKSVISAFILILFRYLARDVVGFQTTRTVLFWGCRFCRLATQCIECNRPHCKDMFCTMTHFVMTNWNCNCNCIILQCHISSQL